MFDRCRFWRKQLSRRADGSLPEAQRGALEDHLARCARCRAAEEADRMLGNVVGARIDLLDPPAARRFDNRVLMELRRSGIPTHNGFEPPRSRWRWLSLGFLRQFAGGALVAAGVTGFCLLSALHPTGSGAMKADEVSQPGFTAATRNEPPVPLDSLLRSPSPRAALLWSTPSVRQPILAPPGRPKPTPTPAVHRQSPVPDSFHGALADDLERS